jgi:hypothetical protein
MLEVEEVNDSVENKGASGSDVCIANAASWTLASKSGSEFSSGPEILNAMVAGATVQRDVAAVYRQHL